MGPLTVVCMDDVHAVPQGGMPDTHGAIIGPSHSASERRRGGSGYKQPHKPYLQLLAIQTDRQTYVHAATVHVYARDTARVSTENCERQGLDNVPHDALRVPRASD